LRDTSNGAAPEAQLAELNSDVHHLEEDFKQHRIDVAKRHAEERRFREAITLSHATLAANVARLDDSYRRLTDTATTHTNVLHELRGMMRLGAFVVGAIAAAVPVIMKVIEHLWR